MSFPRPPDSKSAVRRAGAAIASLSTDQKDYDLVDQWRASHGYVINTFQIFLKRKIEKSKINIEFAQRLKRRNTVIDKLRRRDAAGNPLISDVTSMHDFAGCRMIFGSLAELHDFRSYVHSPQVMRNVEHKLRHEADKYDYIAKPKSTGYRGIHDVYRHFPRGSARKEGSKPWDGLYVEIQYRTRAQHAWATAVEISDLLDGEKTKFEMDQSSRGRFFALSSEIIARNVEGANNAFHGRTTEELKSELDELENQLGILRRLEALKQFEDEEKLGRHNVLNIYQNDQGKLELEVIPYKSATQAVEKATELEESGISLNAVYVGSENPRQLRSAYRNYFNDPLDFVAMIRGEMSY